MIWELRKKKAKLIPGVKGLFLPFFPQKEGLCVIPAYCTEIPDPKQRCAEVLTPSLARTALQLVPVQLYLQSTALSGGSTGSIPRRRCVKQPFALFPARCVLLLPVTPHRPSAYSHLYLRRDLEGSGLHLFPCFLVALYYKMLVFNNSVFYYVLFHWETQKTNPKLQRTWN